MQEVKMSNLLLEIGTEEIPAGYIVPAVDALAANLLHKMTQMRIEHGAAKTFGTPRRLSVIVENVAAKQASRVIEVLGPPQKVAFDDAGNPTVAAQKFAEKVDVPLSKIKVKKTPKGAYLCAQKREPGVSSVDLLKQILPDTILAVPFPKTMRWAGWHIQFARPIHSVVALLGEKIIDFQLEAIQSGRHTQGHSFMHPQKIELTHADQYIETLKSAKVFADISVRRQQVQSEIEKAADALGGGILPDTALLDTVTNLVEYPVASAGKFEEIFLELPHEILITAMREHQKYFAVVDDNNKLMPCFVAVNNTVPKNMELVTTGHERVLRARLADARFFYRSDLDESFDVWVEKLKRVLFQAKLGSVHAKVIRVQKLAGYLADMVSKGTKLKKRILRAAFLCKTDLVSQVVGEFPSLQGAMGRIYATIRKEDRQVSVAIEEHYRPTYSGGPLPETETGALLSIADKIDNISGCFSVGLTPTGASDPYALRRQGIGIIQILLKRGYAFSLRGMIEKNVKLFGARSVKEIRETTSQVYMFLKNRMAHLLAEEGFSRDVIAAVIDVSADNVSDTWRKVRALENLKSAPDFEPLAIAFKRVVNIIKQAGVRAVKAELGTINTRLFQHDSESALNQAFQEVSKKVVANLGKGLYAEALADIASLGDKIDVFFDDVMVMAEDKKLRTNRLNLLGHIAQLFENFADFSKIST